MKKILVPLDFTETSINAVVYALELANKIKGGLVLLHTFELPVIDSQSVQINYAVIYDSIELSNFDYFRETMPKLHEMAEQRNLGHIEMNHILMDGDLVSNIGKVVKKEHIDMVVMGTNGATGWFDTLFGTKTGSAIASISIPVLSVPAEADFEKIETIAFTTRFRKKDIGAMIKVLAIAKILKAKVKCLYVKTSGSDVTDEMIKRWESHFDEEKDLHFFIIPHDDVEETIEDFLINQDVDLLAMLTYKRNFFLKLFTNTTAQKLSYHLRIPILVFHE